jgi:hypothetical protein
MHLSVFQIKDEVLAYNSQQILETLEMIKKVKVKLLIKIPEQ